MQQHRRRPRHSRAAPTRRRRRSPRCSAPGISSRSAPRANARSRWAAEEAAHGRQLRFPATCRRALPILDSVTSWNVGAGRLTAPERCARQGRHRSSARTAMPVSRARGRTARTTGSIRKAIRAPRAALPSRPAEAAATAAQRPTVVDPASAPAPESLPGRYAVMRQPNREACRIVLGPASAGAQARAPAVVRGQLPGYRADDLRPRRLALCGGPARPGRAQRPQRRTRLRERPMAQGPRGRRAAAAAQAGAVEQGRPSTVMVGLVVCS